MQYIQLNNNNYILHLSDGLRTLTIKSFNYHKIQKLINAGATEEEIRPLLVIPELPNGIYEAYELPRGIMIYLHITPTGSQELLDLKSNTHIKLNEEEKTNLNTYFRGIYASAEELLEDWPEFLF